MKLWTLKVFRLLKPSEVILNAFCEMIWAWIYGLSNMEFCSWIRNVPCRFMYLNSWYLVGWGYGVSILWSFIEWSMWVGTGFKSIWLSVLSVLLSYTLFYCMWISLLPIPVTVTSSRLLEQLAKYKLFLSLLFVTVSCNSNRKVTKK